MAKRAGDSGISRVVEALILKEAGIFPFAVPKESRPSLLDSIVHMPAAPVPDAIREMMVAEERKVLGLEYPAPPLDLSDEDVMVGGIIIPKGPVGEITAVVTLDADPEPPPIPAPRAFVRSFLDDDAPAWAREIGEQLADGLDELVSDEDVERLRRWQAGEETTQN